MIHHTLAMLKAPSKEHCEERLKAYMMAHGHEGTATDQVKRDEFRKAYWSHESPMIMRTDATPQSIDVNVGPRAATIFLSIKGGAPRPSLNSGLNKESLWRAQRVRFSPLPSFPHE